jgi:hypothetical protein
MACTPPVMRRPEIEKALAECLRDILRHYDERVTERSAFNDLRAWREVHFDDPDMTLPGKLELVVMSMDERLDPSYVTLRFLSVRVMKSRQGGYASMTCLHGTKVELREQLDVLLHDPDFLVDRVRELADGLPEETNPDVWR